MCSGQILGAHAIKRGIGIHLHRQGTKILAQLLVVLAEYPGHRDGEQVDDH